MKFQSNFEGNTLTFHLEGDLIGENNGLDLIERVNEALNSGAVYSIIDISGLRYINSSGIGVLITILTKFRNKGGEIYLVNPSESVKKLLIITKLNAIFNISDTIEEAMNSIEK